MVALTQPSMSAAAMIIGTKARKSTARVELPRKLRKGHPSGPAKATRAMPQRKNPHAVESATGMMVPP